MTAEKAKVTVLIVDDESEIREILSIHVARCGFDFIEAEDGQRAIETVRAQKIDLIISDIMMPRMSGMMLLRSLRAEGFNCPFIFVTAYPSKEATVEALRLGAFDFIEKPFESEDIVKLIREAVRVLTERNAVLDSAQGAAGESAPPIQPDSAESKILSLRSLRYQVESEPTERKGMNSAEKARMIALFLDEAMPQLVFSEASAKGLGDIDVRPWELGYLFRAMQGIRIAAEAINLGQIAAFASILEGCFAIFRVQPAIITDKHIDLMTLAIPALRDMISVVDSDIDVNPDALDVEQRVGELYAELMKN
jgi:DNA-binding response OmpR family regulator